MPRLRINLDQETYLALMVRADQERRPMDLQAEVMIRQALGLPFPYPEVYDVQAESSHGETLAPPRGLALAEVAGNGSNGRRGR